MRPYGSPKQLEQRRRRAVELFKVTQSLASVSKRIGCSNSSVFRWWKDYEKGGLKALDPIPASGRPEKLKRLQKQKLEKHLLKGALSHGFATDLWTTRRVAKLVQQEFNVDYHPNHVWRLLRSLGWTRQKPEKRARERDERKIARWKRYRWSALKKSAKAWCPSVFP